MKRQRILYLNAVSRSLRAHVVGFAVQEPVESDAPQIEAGVEMPYETVHGAILDGWRVVSFPGPASGCRSRSGRRVRLRSGGPFFRP